MPYHVPYIYGTYMVRVIQQSVYKTKIRDIDDPRKCLMQTLPWSSALDIRPERPIG